MLTGQPPFRMEDDDSTDRLLEQMQKSRYVAARTAGSGIPRYLDRMIATCLRPRPNQRFQSITAVRRTLERKLGRIGQAESRAEIAEEMWRRGVIRAADGNTERKPAARRRKTASTPRRIAWALGTLAAAIAVTAGLWTGAQVRDEPADEAPTVAAREVLSGALPGRTPTEPLTQPVAQPVAEPPVAAPGPADAAPVAPVPESAWLRVAADPWAEMLLPDGSRFLTPRVEPVELPAGEVTIVFEHPTLGRASYDIALEAGGTELLTHRFTEASR
jgi:hypothetical protein